MLKILKTSVTALTPNLIKIKWELESTTESLSDYTISILQSETTVSGLDAYTEIATGISPTYSAEYNDTSITGLTNKFATFTYRIKVIKTSDSSYVVSTPASVAVKKDPASRYIIEHREKVLKHLSGQKFRILKRKTFGQYCPDCRDVTTQMTTKSKCTTCYDTGFTGGYYAPVTIDAQINEAPPRSVITTFGDWQDQDAVLVMSVDPVLTPGDMVIDVYGRRWNVQTIRTTNKAMFLIAQQAQMREIELDDIAYTYPITW